MFHRLAFQHIRELPDGRAALYPGGPWGRGFLVPTEDTRSRQDPWSRQESEDRQLEQESVWSGRTIVAGGLLFAVIGAWMLFADPAMRLVAIVAVGFGALCGAAGVVRLRQKHAADRRRDVRCTTPR